MAGAAPAEVLLDNAVHGLRSATRKVQGGLERNCVPLMQAAGIVSKAHVRGVPRAANAGVQEDIDGLKEFGNEHGSLALRGGGEEVQVLPERPTHRAGNSREVLEAAPAACDDLPDKLGDHHPSFSAELPRVGDGPVCRGVPDYQATKSTVAHEDVCPESQEEERDFQSAGRRDGSGKLLGAGGFVPEISGSADVKRGVRRERYIAANALCTQRRGQFRECRG